jgi:hypothetical protein
MVGGEALPLTRISIIRFCYCFLPRSGPGAPALPDRFAVIQSQIFYSAGLIAELTGSISHRRPVGGNGHGFLFHSHFTNS